MGVPFRRTVQVENTYAEKKPQPKKNWYMVGSDSKGVSYIGTIENAMIGTAKSEAKVWAKKNGLTLDVVNAL